MSITLNILPNSNEIKEFYENYTSFHQGDAGYDLFVPNDIIFENEGTQFIDFGIKCEMIDENNNPMSYYLYPRSSISKTPLIMANSVGIIDAGYRGNIKGALRFTPNKTDITYKISRGTRLLQICHPSLKQFNIKIVNELSSSTRGEGGFGSTN